jgi:hypothetical protein
MFSRYSSAERPQSIEDEIRGLAVATKEEQLRQFDHGGQAGTESTDLIQAPARPKKRSQWHKQQEVVQRIVGIPHGMPVRKVVYERIAKTGWSSGGDENEGDPGPR